MLDFDDIISESTDLVPLRSTELEALGIYDNVMTPEIYMSAKVVVEKHLQEAELDNYVIKLTKILMNAFTDSVKRHKLYRDEQADKESEPVSTMDNFLEEYKKEHPDMVIGKLNSDKKPLTDEEIEDIHGYSFESFIAEMNIAIYQIITNNITSHLEELYKCNLDEFNEDIMLDNGDLIDAKLCKYLLLNKDHIKYITNGEELLEECEILVKRYDSGWIVRHREWQKAQLDKFHHRKPEFEATDIQGETSPMHSYQLEHLNTEHIQNIKCIKRIEE